MQIIKVHGTQAIVHRYKLTIILIALLFTIHYSLFTNLSYSQGVSINNNGMSADNSTIFDLSSTSQGLLIPRMTTAQRDAIVSPALSLLIFNITTNCFEAYVNGQWYSISCPPPCYLPDTPLALTNTHSQTQITWNWSTVSGAIGYKWNTSNDYTSASDNLDITSFTQNSLACNTIYTLYVWAYNNCGKSSPTVISLATDSCISICREWQKTYSGGGSDLAFNCQETTDGGYFIAGVSNINAGGGYGDMYLVKTDGTGNFLWGKTYGGTDYEVAGSTQQTSDGGFIIAGTTRSFGYGEYNLHYYLVKTDASGNLSWSKTYGGSKGKSEGGGVLQTRDGGYIMAGTTNSFGVGTLSNWMNTYVVKTDANGNLLWSRTYGGIGYDGAGFIQQTTDGGYIIAGGTSNSFGFTFQHAYLLKIDDSGNLSWSKAYTGVTQYPQAVAYSVQQTTDGGYILAGTAAIYANNQGDALLIKTDASGNVLWGKDIGSAIGPNGGTEYAGMVMQTADGGYAFGGGSTKSSPGGGNWNYYLVKLDGNGNLGWSKVYGGPDDPANFTQNAVQGTSFGLTTDGGFVMTGVFSVYNYDSNWTLIANKSMWYVVKTDSYGNAAGCLTDTDIINVIDIAPTATDVATQVTIPDTQVDIPATIVTNQTPVVNFLCTKCN
jgi:hypothetical protein